AMNRTRGTIILVGILIAGVVAFSSAWLASGDPDGLERVAEDEEFLHHAEDPGYEILPDYTIPGIDGEISTALAGIVGVVLMLGIGLGAGYLLRRRSEDGERSHAPQE